MTDETPILEVADLRVEFPSPRGTVVAVDGVTFTLRAGETLGLVGESGSGKSVTSMSILGLLPSSARVTGSVRLRGQEILVLKDAEMRHVRGREIAMVFQDALAALNPAMTVGAQLEEAVEVHNRKSSRSERRRRAIELLDTVGIPTPDVRVDQYPHQFSGGMRQRVMIAMALANDPAVLIADEATTALDVTVQAQVLDVFRRIQERTSTAVLLITHDLGVVAGLADRVAVMYAGSVVEEAPVDELFHRTAHPYTRGLLAALPRMDRRDGELKPIPGSPPNQLELPSGCRFHPRCTWAVEGLCDVTEPEPWDVGPEHRSSCLRKEIVMVSR